MKAQGRNWLIGCGIGCLVVVVGLGLLIGGGALLFRQAASGWDEAATVRKELHAGLGRVEAYEPDLAGTLGPGRIEALLRVRERTAAARLELAEALASAQARLEGSSGKLDRLWGLIRSGADVSPLLADFSRRRSEALLEEGLSPGEYLYHYSLVHHCWLGRDPAAGVEGIVQAFAREQGSFKVRLDDRDLGDEDLRDLDRQVRRDLNEHHRRWLSFLLREAESASTGRGGPADLVEDLRRELERLRQDHEALPWRDGLPRDWERRLEPYRVAFEAAWDPLGDLVELLDEP